MGAVFYFITVAVHLRTTTMNLYDLYGLKKLKP
jgi:hypothetical protein